MNKNRTIQSAVAMYAAFTLLAACAPASHDSATTAEASTNQTQTTPPLLSAQVARIAVVRLLDSSAAAWTRGDLDGFMADYAPGYATTFVTSKGVLRGPEAIQQMYAPRFTEGATQDSLTFEEVEVDVISNDALHVLAYYRLMRGDSTTARGPTSLIMRWIDGKWRITHDHSS